MDENNALSNYDDFVNESDEIVNDEEIIEVGEPDEEIEVEEEVEEVEEPQEDQVKEPVKKVKTIEPAQKEEHAWGKLKAENKALKEENASLKDMFSRFEDRLNGLENKESERGYSAKKATLKRMYMDEHDIEESLAEKMAQKDIDYEIKLSGFEQKLNELTTTKKSEFDVKTSTEQELLYKQAQAKKAKVDLPDTQPIASTIKMTSEQKRVYEMTKKTPWGKGMTAKQFMENWKSTS